MFWCVLFSFSFISKYFLISLIISSLNHWLFRSMLFNIYVSVSVPVFLLLLISNFFPMWKVCRINFTWFKYLNGNPLQYSCLENSMDRGAWQATVHGVTRVWHNLVTKSNQRYCCLFYDLTYDLSYRMFHVNLRRCLLLECIY